MAILVASMFTLARATAGAATAYSTVQPGTFTGYAFDACTAPPSASMAAWRASSPYRGIGIYIGGNNRGCTQANLTAEWVQEQVTAGWKLLPLYVGPQATCTTTTKKNYIDNANATAHGRDTATDAVAQAAALGLAKQSVLIYDMEAYRTNDAACRQGVLAFMNGWTSRLHDLGYFSGFYSSVSSGVADQVANYNAPGYAPPDYMDFARWDNVVTLEDPVIPAGYWSPHRRMKQYRGPAKETYGGVTINIDLNYVDFAPLPAAKLADFSGNGWSDVLARYPGNGNLYLYPGNGSTVGTGSARRTLSGGWNSMNAIVRIGDLNKDGKEDVVARQTNGDLWFYPGTGTGFGTRKKLATGWGGLREITAVGDLNGDGYPDLAAIESSTNKLFLYPGRSGTKLGTRGPISGGWRTYRELAGVGDFNRDGLPDMAARDNADAGLYVYLGRKGGFQGRIKVGSGWNGMRDVLGVGDFNRDGFTDLAAIRGSDSSLMLYRGTGSSLKAGVRLTPLTGYAPLA
ncbi:glycoside hydrolase domain-containing protein [Paractinoplanes rishiriensis]|nr:glycoside hydrolase domain-containing protein [Actinoplanes rishiriensis]